MKILYLTDIHQYSLFMFDRFFNTLPNDCLYDIVIIGGDMSNGNLDLLKIIITRFNKPVYFVLGNHDYYYHSIEKVISFCLENNLNILYGKNEYKLNYNEKEYTLIGGTGWSSYNLYTDKPKKQYMLSSENGINDFKLIRYKDKLIKAKDYVNLHNSEWEFFCTYKNKENVILVTHFPMSKVCLDPYFENNLDRQLNPYFINNKDTTGFKLILSGHTHTCVNKVDEFGCRHIVNAYGYESEFNRIYQNNVKGTNGFNSHLIINTDDYL